MLNPDKRTIEWAAQWIDDALKAETNERTIEFGKNMVMTFRAVVLPSADFSAEGAELQPPELVSELQRELAFYFGYWHSRSDHRLSTLQCEENSCVRIRQLLARTASVATTPDATRAGDEVMRLTEEVFKRTEDCRGLINKDRYTYQQAFEMVEKQVQRVRARSQGK